MEREEPKQYPVLTPEAAVDCQWKGKQAKLFTA
jgi:hypothetical protein